MRGPDRSNESSPRGDTPRVFYLVVGGACGLLANGVQVPFFWLDVVVPVSFVASYLVTVLTIHILAALLLGGRYRDRLWAVTVLAIPVTAALWPLAERLAGLPGIIVFSAAAFAACVVWARLPLGYGSPLMSGSCGALLGAVLLMFRSEHPEGLQADVATLGVYGLSALTLLVIGLFVGVPVIRRTATVRPYALVGILATAIGWVGSGRGSDAWLVPTPRPETRPARPRIVLIVLDTLRADHLKSYGYGTDTMPRLERFASTYALRAERSISTSSWSLPSHASMFTGLYPPRHGAHLPYADSLVKHELRAYSLRGEVPVLADLLRDLGYWTVGISANQLIGQLARGFDRFENRGRPCDWLGRHTPWRLSTNHTKPLADLDRLPPFSGCGFFGIADEYWAAAEITDDAIDVLDAAGDHPPLFLFVNYLDAHQPLHYREHPFGKRYETIPAVLEAIWSDQHELGPRDVAWLNELYDGELAYLDQHLDRLLRRLVKDDQWEETLLIVTSDHGESLGERGLVGHMNTLYDEVLRVPFFVKAPSHPGLGAEAPPESIELIQPVDIFPTILEHAGSLIPPNLDGVPWGRGRTQVRAWLFVNPDAARFDPVRLGKELQSLEQDNWKLIADSSGNVELYNLDADPLETNNLADQEPGITSELASRLWSREVYADPYRTQVDEPDPELLERLRSLGYIR